ncbi:hypothetical protein TTHERM_000145039 (macronuclear) [Tetrahymena thermophila SB210]|uniref:Uncharacterized protein n=1 Tax=Tetrahymena thermophila (strain SB210) TaxID=312017 RepID=W7XFN4_TETTS|nr:hypothetical protein TTHERM_000145039 [Tetrahymena thermophila SB210]EWS75658.1 hypothetical protein TTHERM_000145039 [Tetrahymena thermophila SB210]|eukprot:XP_012651804.1 hypothetical protein TTHERM_000145039 [Tetrahymena thermophila SB210]
METISKLKINIIQLERRQVFQIQPKDFSHIVILIHVKHYLHNNHQEAYLMVKLQLKEIIYTDLKDKVHKSKAFLSKVVLLFALLKLEVLNKIIFNKEKEQLVLMKINSSIKMSQITCQIKINKKKYLVQRKMIEKSNYKNIKQCIFKKRCCSKKQETLKQWIPGNQMDPFITMEIKALLIKAMSKTMTLLFLLQKQSWINSIQKHSIYKLSKDSSKDCKIIIRTYQKDSKKKFTQNQLKKISIVQKNIKTKCFRLQISNQNREQKIHYIFEVIQYHKLVNIFFILVNCFEDK